MKEIVDIGRKSGNQQLKYKKNKLISSKEDVSLGKVAS